MVILKIARIGCLLIFLALLLMATFPLVSGVPVEFFLRLDPLIFAVTLLGSWAWIPALLPAVGILLLTLILGRFFCSAVCPMGATIDLVDSALSRCSGRPVKMDRSRHEALIRVKYVILIFLLGAALGGLSLIQFFSPMALITRFYGMLVLPVVTVIGEMVLGILRPAARLVGLSALEYAVLDAPRFALQWLTVMIFAGVFACAFFAPRFWCRYLCPAGAIFAVCSRRPVLRRSVNENCIRCGLCQEGCPMDAIGEDPFDTVHSECIGCRTCVRVCPENAVSFTGRRPVQGKEGNSVSAGRRGFICAAITGVFAGLITKTGIGFRSGGPVEGELLNPGMIRPPGALPEKEFLLRCVRCGECMKACPTNTLQPAWFEAGLEGMVSPVIRPRRGPCEPGCAVCGQVCPTGAIRALSLEEKTCAKVGTAYVIRHKCLAWEFDQACLICDEVCPYGAIGLKTVPEIQVAVPFVDEKKCNGCGFCEYYCPVQAGSAIVVEPMDEIRLESGSYCDRARELGFSFREKQPLEHVPGQQGPDAGESRRVLPPGFTE
ncbi:MAG: 4Fe-4S binding protein [Desulfomonilia bacterium]